MGLCIVSLDTVSHSTSSPSPSTKSRSQQKPVQTCFWMPVKSGKGEDGAHEILKGTLSKDKNKLLFLRFQMNYNNTSGRVRALNYQQKIFCPSSENCFSTTN